MSNCSELESEQPSIPAATIVAPILLEDKRPDDETGYKPSAIREHNQLDALRAVYNLDDVCRVLSFGEACGLVGRCLLVPKCARRAVVLRGLLSFYLSI